MVIKINRFMQLCFCLDENQYWFWQKYSCLLNDCKKETLTSVILTDLFGLVIKRISKVGQKKVLAQPSFLAIFFANKWFIDEICFHK